MADRLKLRLEVKEKRQSAVPRLIGEAALLAAPVVATIAGHHAQEHIQPSVDALIVPPVAHGVDHLTAPLIGHHASHDFSILAGHAVSSGVGDYLTSPVKDATQSGLESVIERTTGVKAQDSEG